MKKNKKLLVIWTLVSVVGVFLSTLVSFFAFAALDINSTILSVELGTLLRKLSLYAVLQSLAIGFIQSAMLKFTGSRLALWYFAGLVSGMVIGEIAPVLLHVLTSDGNSIVPQSWFQLWFLSWILGGAVSGYAGAPRRKWLWSGLNAIAFLLYAISGLFLIIFTGVALDEPGGFLAQSFLLGIIIFIPFAAVGSLINGQIATALLKET